MVGRWFYLGLSGLLGAGCSVGNVDNSTPFGESQSVADDSDGASDGGTTGAMTTGGDTDPTGSSSDDSLTASGPDDNTSGEATTSGDGGESSSSGGWTSRGGSESSGGMVCGNGVIEGNESCDGGDLGALGCPDVGDFVGGILSCDAVCEFDTSACMVGEPVSICENINLSIPDNGSAVTTLVNVPSGGSIADVTVSVDLTHSWIGDLSIGVEHNGTNVSLYNGTCGSNEDISLVFDDAGAAINCAASTSGAATLPAQPLSAFDGMDASGGWTFSFQDSANDDIGSVTQICVNVDF